MRYSLKDLLSDLGLLLVLGLLGSGVYFILKPSLSKMWVALFHQKPQAPPVAAGTPAYYEWSVTSMDGRVIPLSALKGKVIFLNFWATWCGPCKMELPSIEKLYRQFNNADVVFLLVSEENQKTLAAFIHKRGIEVPIYSVRRTPASFHVAGLPTTFILSRSGDVALSQVGAKQWNSKAVVNLLKTLLDEKA